MTPIAFVDTETTHLDAEIGQAWEVAVILREEDGGQTTDTEYVWQFAVDLAVADPEALRIGRYHERNIIGQTCDCEAAFTEPNAITCMTRSDAVKAVINVLSGTVMVGSNPGFDDRFLRKLLGPGCAQWHYRPIDIAVLAAGRKLGIADVLRRFGGRPLPSDKVALPFSSRDLSRWMGVEPPGDGVAHTALGDARWTRDVFDAVTGGAL
ncbi:hypothetical protein [Streptomyces sp. NPDC057413]|uniref:3'-5' exonuclease n=1 Tax=Streptomyces sp. NPDC057413 TaxID=3346124 RepID=UPI003682252F